MKDFDFLVWLHRRMVNVYGEDELVDYMHKLRCLIARAYEEGSITINTGQGMNHLDELLDKLKGKKEQKV